MKVNAKIQYHGAESFLQNYLSACGCEVSHIQPNLKPLPSNLTCDWAHRYNSFCIVQDCDMDGVMSAAIVYNYLRYIVSNDKEIHVVFHGGKQHGLHDVIDEVIATNAECVIVPDAGSGDVEESKRLYQYGKKVIVLDHHEYEYNENNPADITNCKDWKNGKSLSGGGVCAYITQSQYDLAACSIVSDVMPLNDLTNRYFVKYGFSHINNPFLLYLVDKLDKRYLLNGKPTPKWVAWTLAPLVNAVCRSYDQEAKELMFRAFVNEADFDKALKSMRQKHRIQRDKINTLYEQLVDVADDSHKFVVCMADADDKNYLGLAANKMMGEKNRPIIVLRELDSTRWCGSMRSPIDMLSIVNNGGYAACQGHERACGIQINKSQLDRFLCWCDNLNIDMQPPIDIACEMRPMDCTLSLVDMLAENADLWGQDLPEPIFYSKFTVPIDKISIFRKTSNTLRIDIDGMSFIKFGVSNENAEAIENGESVDFQLTYRLVVNEYEGNRSVQGIIDKIEFNVNHNNIVIDDFDFDNLFKE